MLIQHAQSCDSAARSPRRGGNRRTAYAESEAESCAGREPPPPYPGQREREAKQQAEAEPENRRGRGREADTTAVRRTCLRYGLQRVGVENRNGGSIA